MPKIRLNNAQRDAAISQIRQCHLFCDLDASELTELMRTLSFARLSEGEVLFHQTDAAKEVFLLRSGRIKLVRQSAEGHEKIIDFVSPGMTFAEAVIFSKKQSYPVAAIALIDSDVWCVDGSQYLDILRRSTQACFAVMAEMSRRLHGQVSEIERLTLHNAASRLVAYLLDQVQAVKQGSTHVELNMPKQVIASRLSITPETLSRTFAKLTNEGLIQVHDGGVTLIDTQKLRRYVYGDAPG